jgi:hypothetical protein
MSANIPDTSNERQHLDVQGTPGHLPHRVPLIRSLISPAKFLARRGFQCSEHVETALHHHQQKTKKIAAPESPPKPRRSNYRDGDFAGVAILNWLATPHSISLFA